MQPVYDFLAVLGTKGVKLSLDGEQLNCFAQPGVMTPELAKQIGQMRVEIVSLLRGQADDAPPPGSRFPLSSGQEGIYSLQRLAPGASTYNVPMCFRSTGPIEARHLDRAWTMVQRRFPILTARFAEADGRVWHELDARRTSQLVVETIATRDDAAFADLLRERVRRPFDLAAGPLTRAELLLRPGRDATLLLTAHHILVDGISTVLLLRALFECYEGLRAGGQPPSRPEGEGYDAFVAWEEAMLASPEGHAHRDFWRDHLADASIELTLPASAEPVATAETGARLIAESLPAELADRIAALSRRESVPPSAIFLAAYQLLLHRVTGQDDLVVTMPAMGRPGGRFRKDVGYFINMVPLRSTFDPRTDFVASAKQAMRTMTDALFHSSYPLPRIAGDISEAGVNPFRILFAFQNVLQLGAVTGTERMGLPIEMLTDIAQEAAGDFELEVFEQEQGYTLNVKYQASVVASDTARRLVGQLLVILDSVTADPAVAAQDRPLLTSAQRDIILEGFNDTAVAYQEADRLLHQLVEAQVDRTPDAPAVLFGTEALTCRELEARANRLAHRLAAQGCGPDARVAVAMERSPDLVIALLAVLKAGGAYVPIDPDYPADRIAYMLADSAPIAVLTQAHLAALLPDRGVPVIAVDGADAAAIAQAPAIRPEVAGLTCDNLCYMIYTSGSTGQPKGAMNEHRAVVNRLLWMQERYGLGVADRVLQKTPYSFDVSVWEFFWPLLTGAPLVVAPPQLHKDPYALADLIESAGVTVLHFVPSMLRVFLEALAPGRCAGIRQIVCSGEELPAALANRCRAQLPQAALANLYGPTEAAIDVTFWDCGIANDDVRVPIGRPIANTRMYVLDARLQPLPVGIAGDLFIGGVAVGRGYLNKDELTADRFLADPFVAGGRMYKTGDLGRWMADGTIDYLGRSDFQIKIRGLRVELGEIEERLGRCQGVRDAVVIVREDVPGDQRLVAYVTLTDAAALDIENLRARLGESLPDYMVPAAFVALDQMPLSPNGKLDRKALPVPGAPAYSVSTYEPPATPEEELLASVWADLLGIDTIGRGDDFFRLGGHSLLAVRLEAVLRERAGVAMPLRTMFEAPVLSQQAEALSELIRNRDDTGFVELVAQQRTARAVTSSAQVHLWFLDQLNPASSVAYNMPSALRMTGRLDRAALRAALDTVVDRHEVLRTRFVVIGGEPMQELCPHLKGFPLRLLDYTRLPEDKREQAVLDARLADARTRFDLDTGPMIRGTLIQLADEEHVLIFTQHHIASDGWSSGVLVQELTALYRAYCQGFDNPLDSLPVQYADYSIWQRDWLRSAEMHRQLGYWTDLLAGAPPLLELPFDRPRPKVQDFQGANISLNLPPELVIGLRRFSQRHGSTLFMTLLTAWAVTLYNVGGQGDMVIGTAVANRRFAAVESLVGFFVNTLAVRVRPHAADTLDALMAQVKATMLDVYANQDLPFEYVVKGVQHERSLGYSPIFQTMVTLNNTPTPIGAAMPGLQVERMSHIHRTAQFETTLGLTESRDGLAGEIEYQSALFDRGTVERIARHFEMVLGAMAAGGTVSIQSLAGLGDSTQIGPDPAPVDDDDAATADFRMVHRQFEDHAARAPEAEAIRWGEVSVTYGDLNARANRLAHRLVACGVGPDGRVVICLPRSVETFVATMATLKAGGAYVPVDAAYPSERIAHILDDSDPAVVIVDTRTRGVVEAADPSGRVRYVDLDEAGLLDGLPAGNQIPVAGVGDANLAYVIYTSGTTGMPKGVMVEHRHIAAMSASWRKLYGLEAGMRHLQMANYTFDVCTGDICRAFTNGGTLVLCPRESMMDGEALYELMVRERIVMGDYVPIVLRQLLDHLEASGGTLPDLRLVACGADVWPLADALRLQALVAPNVRQFNSYGVTEAAVDSVFYETSGVDLAARSTLPIGRAMPYARAYLLDEHRQRVPIGASGELYIGGRGVARGYLNLPTLTAERFVPDPFSAKADGRMYRTGDLGRMLPDGNVEYLGRNDFQIKIRGFRVELGESEAALLACEGIREAVVTARGDASGGNRLVAYYTAMEDAATSPGALREAMARSLPDFMVPYAYVRLDALPVTANGKIDRAALPSPDDDDVVSDPYDPPEGEIEQALALIWSEVLGVERIGRHDDFFRLGGHSLLAVRVMTRIKSRFGRSMPIAALFNYSDIAGLACALAEEVGRVDAVIVPIQPGGRDRPLFAVPGAGGNMMSFAWLSLAIDERRRGAGLPPLPFYGLRALGLDGAEKPPESIEDTAAINVAALRQVQPDGPYRLAGFSYGGAVVYEMARQLREQGEGISSLLLLDSYAPWAIGGDVESDETILLADLEESIRQMFPEGARDLDMDRLMALGHAERGEAVGALLAEHGVEADGADLGAFFHVFQANVACYHAYRPVALDGAVPMTLVRIEREDESLDDYGWGKVLGRPPLLRRVAGDHTTMLDRDHAAALVEMLAEVTDLVAAPVAPDPPAAVRAIAEPVLR